eukprot:CAMPEP_0203887908 /NCGR_PEP_ID=MMETSP0359-20131031/31566_1 /ASSEMBLY_ACC=CAM_ASM_000338 /TAXON_ID=268821 /ORGANISM="Scrippsiella Hangoei, Strain SHTV-5" /LENGTH=148 /DNA_ID=CAMNT_0050809015 /DNA_START=37 /DNA_END=480 /DNA_ORIENTATION=+
MAAATVPSLPPIAPSRGQSRWIGVGGSGADGEASDWAVAVDRTRRREASVRAKQERARAEARLLAEAQEAERQAAEDVARGREEARRRRIEALVVAKQQGRRLEEERARQRRTADEAMFVDAIAQRREREREIRAMEAEEEAARAELA